MLPSILFRTDFIFYSFSTPSFLKRTTPVDINQWFGNPLGDGGKI
jgi:hypothetical protein